MDISMAPFAKGILTAFIMTVGVGPGMLLNFQTSLHRGFIAGLSVVAGLYLSDGIFIAINYFGVFYFIKSFQHQRLGGIVCGSILCVLGICMICNKKMDITIPQRTGTFSEKRNLLKGFLSGFVVNILNPFVFVFWMTLMSIATLNFGFRTYPFFIYFAAVIGTAICLDIVKSYLFSRIKTGLKEKVMSRINHGIGAVLASFGIVIICRSIVFLG